MRSGNALVTTAVVLALASSVAALSLAWSSDGRTRAADERTLRLAERVHADAVLLREDFASDPSEPKSARSVAVGVANYGTLPVMDVVVVGDSVLTDLDLPAQLRLGTLLPCQGESYATEEKFGAKAVYFTDANGLRWRRAADEPPVKVNPDEPATLDASRRDIVTQDLTGC